MSFGLMTLVPPIIVIAIAILSKKPIESLLIGCISAYAIIAAATGQNFIDITVKAFFKTATNYDNVWLLMVCGLFGSLIALLHASGSTIAIAELIGRYCKKAKTVLMSSWLLGIIIFIDDYMNIMTISSCMKKLCDKKGIPRQALAYIIDSTGAPACVLVPFSTWAIFYASSFFEQEAVQQLGLGSAMSSFIHAIPYTFYASIALIIVPLFILKIIPPIGPMKEAYLNYTNYAETVENEKRQGKIIDFFVPILTMIVLAIGFGDMFIALIAAILVCFLLYVPRKIISLSEFCDLWIKGFGNLIPTLAVLLFAFFMKQACADIALPEYVVGCCLPYVTAQTFPVVAFVLVSILAFVTGDSWGVPAVCVPIIMPLAGACGANILLTMGAVISGGVFCSHACFYSDATVLTASCCDIEAMDHARTQLPYAIIGFALSGVLYLSLGFVL